jgi:hypothetical protein
MDANRHPRLLDHTHPLPDWALALAPKRLAETSQGVVDARATVAAAEGGLHDARANLADAEAADRAAGLEGARTGEAPAPPTVPSARDALAEAERVLQGAKDHELESHMAYWRSLGLGTSELEANTAKALEKAGKEAMADLDHLTAALRRLAELQVLAAGCEMAQLDQREPMFIPTQAHRFPGDDLPRGVADALALLHAAVEQPLDEKEVRLLGELAKLLDRRHGREAARETAGAR